MVLFSMRFEKRGFLPWNSTINSTRILLILKFKMYVIDSYEIDSSVLQETQNVNHATEKNS